MEFDFISDTKFRNILKRDFLELEKCLEIKANKAVLVLSGSIIEAILTEYFLNNLPNKMSKEQIMKQELYSLIDLAFEKKLITQKAKDLSTVIKSYRNLIHPGREIRENEQFDDDTAIVSFSLLKIITSEVKENYLKKYGYTAKDIVSKLETDYLSYSIFEQLVERINFSEKTILLNDLTEYELNGEREPFTYISNLKMLIQTLKSLLSKEIILEQLKKLLKKVQIGEQSQIVKLYNLYHEDLQLLPQADREIIVTYMLTYLEHNLEQDEIKRFTSKRTFSTIGNYIDSPRLKQQLKDFISTFFREYDYKDAWAGTEFYEQLMNSCEPMQKKDLEEYVENEISEYLKTDFKKHLQDKELPF